MAYNQQNPATNEGQYGQGPMDKLANAIPGHHTGAPGSMPGSNNPSGHAGQHQQQHNTGLAAAHNAEHHQHGTHGTASDSTFGAGNTAGAGYGSSNTAGAGYGSSNTHSSGLQSATHGTHEHGLNQGPADKAANMIPGHHTGAPGAAPGSHNPSHSASTTHSAHGTHGSSNYDSNSGLNSATHGTHEHGLNQGPADRMANAAPGHHTGAPGAVPGSHNPSGHHATGEHVHQHNQHSGTMSGGGFGAGEARAHDHDHHNAPAGAHSTTGAHHTGAHDPNAKPSMADKIGGKIDVMVGKATHNEQKVMQGEIKQTEGKAGLEHNAAAGAGRI